jgi:hypothetical protein
MEISTFVTLNWQNTCLLDILSEDVVSISIVWLILTKYDDSTQCRLPQKVPTDKLFC